MRIKMAMVGLFVLLGLTGCSAQRTTSPTTHPATVDVVVYSGPNMRVSLETIADRYKKETGQHVTVIANDVRPLIARIKSERDAGQGVPDLFCTHDPFLQTLISDGVEVKEAWPVASLVPVIVVKKGNPKSITGLRDLARPGLRVGMTDAVQTISGEIMRVMFRRAGIEDQVRANVVVRTSQGRDLCKALIADQCDVGIVWNAVIVGNADQVEAVAIAEEFRPKRGVDAEVNSTTLGKLELDYVRVSLALLKDAQRPEAAQRFVDFVRNRDSAAVFAANGFSQADPARPALPGR